LSAKNEGDPEISLDDDTGSETLARYGFQELLTASAVIEMLTAGGVDRILCESDEDYVVISASGPAEFVSVKHREPDQGPWTLATLCSDGGLKHLFDTWRAQGRSVRLKLQTNAGLKTGQGEARRLAMACNAADAAGFDDFTPALKARLQSESDSEVVAFLCSLRINDGLPKRDDLRPRLLEDLRAKISALGWSRENCEARFDLVCAEIRKASHADRRAAARDPAVPSAGLTTAAVRARAIAQKTIDIRRIESVLRTAERATLRNSRPLLVQKLECGGIGPTGVSRARHLQERWMKLHYKWSSDLPGDVLDQLRGRVLRCAELAERAERKPGDYGVDMQQRLEECLREEIAAGIPSFVDEDALLGLAYDETDRCNIQWCVDFVPEKAIG
jgi:hypothetical protein